MDLGDLSKLAGVENPALINAPDNEEKEAVDAEDYFPNGDHNPIGAAEPSNVHAASGNNPMKTPVDEDSAPAIHSNLVKAYRNFK